MVFIVYLAAESMYGLYTVGICGMLTSFFLMLDLLNTLIFLGILMLRVQFIDGNEDLLERNVRSENIFVSLHTIAFYSVLENILMALNAFILWIKVFKYLNVNKQFYFLSRLFAAAALELVYFTAVFLLIFIAFAHSGYLLFSEDVAEFRSFYNAFVNLFASLTGRI